jgi:hypothetical protein
MKFLIDTNVFIPLEPTAPSETGALTSTAAAFAQKANRAGFSLFVHPAQARVILNDRDEQRRELRKSLLGKYPPLPDPPLSVRIDSILGAVDENSHDWVDHQLLAALHADAVDTLVTEDVRIHRKAKRLGLQHRVAYVTEAITELDALSDAVPPALPAVETTKAHNLDSSDPIFVSVRRDYPEFDVWLTKCKREHRQAWIVACGNALRKAYLCNSGSREIRPGSILAFYRSEDVKALTVLAVTEDTLVSDHATEIARFVGKRTVYPFSEIERLCEKELLAILFRQTRVLEAPLLLDNLLRNKIIAAAPQSITKLSLAARKWIQTQLQ